MPCSSASFSCIRWIQPPHCSYRRRSNWESIFCLGERTSLGSWPPCAMTAATVLRLTCKRRAISRSGMPSWWSRKIALRLSASIMEVSQAVVKSSDPAQDGCGEQIGLGVKGPAFELRVLAFGDEPLHVLVGQLQIPQRRALKVAAAVRILASFPQSFQRQGQMALDEKALLPSRLRSGNR